MTDNTIHTAVTTVDSLHLLEQIAREDDLPYGIRLGVCILHTLLQRCASSAVRLNDPELNITMLKLHLYDVENVSEEIDKQKELLKEGTK